MPCPAAAGIPQVYYFGQEGLHNILVIDLLGPSMEDLFDMCGRKFSVKTCCMVAKQMVSLVLRALELWWSIPIGQRLIVVDDVTLLRSPGSRPFTRRT